MAFLFCDGYHSVSVLPTEASRLHKSKVMEGTIIITVSLRNLRHCFYLWSSFIHIVDTVFVRYICPFIEFFSSYKGFSEVRYH
jgi:hypothetical protein